MSSPNNAYKTRRDLSTTGATAATGILAASIGMHRGGGVQLTGTFTATLAFEETLDSGTTWIAKTVYPAGGGAGVTSATATGQWKFATGGSTNFRVRCSAFTSGPVTVDIALTEGVDPVAEQSSGTAGTASGGVQSVQGVVGGVGLPVVQTRPAIVKGTITYGQTTYGANVGVGSLVTVATGLPAGTVVRINRLAISIPTAVVTTVQNLFGHVFDANPSASTFTDNTTIALVAADIAKLIRVTSAAAGQSIGGATEWVLLTTGGLHHLTTDGSGNLYFALSCSTASLVFTGTGTLAYRLELSY